MYKDIFYIDHYRAHRSFAVTFLIPFFLLAVFASPAVAVDDAYLKALEVEAEKSAQVDNNTKSINGSAQSKGGIQINQKEMMQFETELKSARPATYRFYKKLDQEEKSAVFAVYQKEHKMTRASKTVFDLYFEKNK